LTGINYAMEIDLNLPNSKLNHIFVLHRYWIWSDAMRNNFFQKISVCEVEKFDLSTYVGEIGMYLSYWYSSLYAVLEGYRCSELSNSEVDRLLEDSQKVDMLRKFRNGVFHVQVDYFSAKHLEFLNNKETGIWASELTESLGKFLLISLKR